MNYSGSAFLPTPAPPPRLDTYCHNRGTYFARPIYDETLALGIYIRFDFLIAQLDTPDNCSRCF